MLALLNGLHCFLHALNQAFLYFVGESVCQFANEWAFPCRLQWLIPPGINSSPEKAVAPLIENMMRREKDPLADLASEIQSKKICLFHSFTEHVATNFREPDFPWQSIAIQEILGFNWLTSKQG